MMNTFQSKCSEFTSHLILREQVKTVLYQSVCRMIAHIISPENHPLLFAIGCGPEIYTERFSEKGYQVTEIDFSKRSACFARRSVNKKGLSIGYIFQNYLDMILE